MRSALALFAPLALALQASAHGYIGYVKIDGKEYKGNGDGGDPSTTAIRPTKPYDVGPVVDVTDPQMSCGLMPVSNAKLVADANPGSALEVLWVGQGNANVRIFLISSPYDGAEIGLCSGSTRSGR